LIARRVRRIKRELDENAFPRTVSRCDLLQLDQIRAANFGVLVDAIKKGRIPQARPLDIRWRLCMAKVIDRADDGLTFFAGPRRTSTAIGSGAATA
jgi:hypothetical protein